MNGVAAVKFNLPLCLFDRHVPRRSRVKWDGLNFVGPCRYCKQPIRRLDNGRWVKDQEAVEPVGKKIFKAKPE